MADTGTTTAAAAGVELQTKPATIVTPGVILIISIWGLLLMVPVIISMMVVSVLRFGTVTFLFPLATIAAATFFLPLGFANPYVARLVRSLRPAGVRSEDVFLVQLTRQPRGRSGFSAILEDADDVGFLSLTDSALNFDGDSVRLTVRYDQLKDLELQNAGWRALFAYGPRTAFSVASLPEAGRFEFAERSSWHLPGSRRNAREIFQRLSDKIRERDSGEAKLV